ncbi:hypothetical protein [Kitasatospora sp. NPDC059571]|uniref:hypothetical protein n=1 Tax=Kitasatospora sp. NPDC059571 TaxID=3346871 RepID=UPI0036C1F820
MELFVALLQLTGETDRLLFEGGDAALELVDVVGSAESGVSPRPLAEELGELAIQGPDLAVRRPARSWALARSDWSEARVTTGQEAAADGAEPLVAFGYVMVEGLPRESRSTIRRSRALRHSRNIATTCSSLVRSTADSGSWSRCRAFIR